MSTEPRAQAQWLRGADASLVVAIYVARTGHEQFHAGLYHRDHGAARVLHFAWDRALRNDAPDEVVPDEVVPDEVVPDEVVPDEVVKGRDYVLVALSLDEDDAQTLCALCRQVYGRHSATLRFRFAEGRPRFDSRTAEVTPPMVDDRHGFTCATFVLAMLRSALLEELLALDEWPVPAPNDADDRWQRRLVRLLCPAEAPPEDVAAVLAGIGARRVRPTDVAGGAMQSREQWPVGFVDSRREGEQIATRL